MKLKRRLLLLFIGILLIFTAVYTINYFSLNDTITLNCSKDQMILNNDKYSLVDSNIIENRGFLFETQFDIIKAKTPPFIKTIKICCDNNIIIEDTIFGFEYYLKSGFKLPEINESEIESITVEFSDKEDKNYSISKTNEIKQFIYHDALSYKNQQGYIIIKFKSISSEEIIPFEYW